MVTSQVKCQCNGNCYCHPDSGCPLPDMESVQTLIEQENAKLMVKLHNIKIGLNRLEELLLATTEYKGMISRSYIFKRGGTLCIMDHERELIIHGNNLAHIITILTGDK